MLVWLEIFLRSIECSRVAVVKIFPSLRDISKLPNITDLLWPVLMILEIVHAALAVLLLDLIVWAFCSVAQKLNNISAT
jgi:hypothetical protein